MAPPTPLEGGLAIIWQDVLGIAEVGIDDDFFDLGGHSLLAMQVVVRAREMFGVDLPLTFLFDMPTIRRQAAALSALSSSGPLA